MTPEAVLTLINQWHLLHVKLSNLPEAAGTLRHLRRMKEAIEGAGYLIDVPLGEPYNPQRTDLEVSMVPGTLKPIILEVVKPVVYFRHESGSSLLQRGVVIAGDGAQ